jgi:hypothetical protein
MEGSHFLNCESFDLKYFGSLLKEMVDFISLEFYRRVLIWRYQLQKRSRAILLRFFV